MADIERTPARALVTDGRDASERVGFLRSDGRFEYRGFVRNQLALCVAVPVNTPGRGVDVPVYTDPVPLDGLS